MRYFKPFLQIIHKVFIIELIFCFTLIIYFPDKVAEVTGYRLYTVLSDSMEPVVIGCRLVLLAIPSCSCLPGIICVTCINLIPC